MPLKGAGGELNAFNVKSTIRADMGGSCSSASDTEAMPDVIRFTPDAAEPIIRYGATSAYSVRLGSGSRESHAYVLYFDPGGEIETHKAGFDQLFAVVSGEAWLTVDGSTVELVTGEAGVVRKGSMHAKGSRSGAIVVMIQMLDLTTD